MQQTLPKIVHVVAATKDGETQFWAAATSRNEAVARVLQRLPRGWTATLMRWQLTAKKIAQLNLEPNAVEKLGRVR
jgi:hypothetical protein